MKVKASMMAVKEQGKYVGSVASFGYAKDPEDRHKFVIAEDDKVRELNRMKVYESFAVTKLTAELLEEYVEGIEVHPGNEVRISWK